MSAKNMTSNYSIRIRFLFFIFIFLALWFINKSWYFEQGQLEQLLNSIPLVYSALVYVISYVVVTFFLFFSKDIFWLLGALIFGPGLSAILIWFAELVNAVILFNLSRAFGRGYVEARLGLKETAGLGRRLAGLSFFWLFILRAVPLIPYRFLDLAAGLTPLSFRRYMLAAILGSPVKIFWMQYILAAVGRAAILNPKAVADYFSGHPKLLIFSLVYVVFVIMVAMRFNPKEKK